MTRTAVNGSPASAIVGGCDVRVRQARRRRVAAGPRPMVGGWERRSRGRAISDWFTRDWPESSTSGHRGAIAAGGTRTNLHLSRYRTSTVLGHACRAGQTSGAGPRVRPRRSSPRTRADATMDPDRIPTEPTTDAEPPAATSLTTGPSQAPTSPAARSRTPVGAPRRGRRARVGRDVHAPGSGSASVAPLRHGRHRQPAPSPASAWPTFELIQEAWDTLHKQYVGRADLDDQALDLRGHQRPDRGRRRHGPHRLHDARGAGGTERRAVRLVRRDRRPDRRPTDGRPAADRRASSRTARPRQPASWPATSSSRSTASRPRATTSTTSPAGSAARPGPTVELTVRRTAPMARERTYTITRADVALEPVIVDAWSRAPRPPCSASTRSRTGSADDDRQGAQGRSRRPARDRLVLDLRGNPGGYVNEAVGIASQFLADGRRLYRAQRRRQRDAPPGLARRRRARTCRSSSSSTRTPPAPPRSSRAPCRMRAAPRSSATRRSGPGRSSASSSCRDGSALRDRDRRVADAQGPADLAPRHRAGRRRRTPERRRAADAGRRPRYDARSRRFDDRPAARAGAQPGGVGSLGSGSFTGVESSRAAASESSGSAAAVASSKSAAGSGAPGHVDAQPATVRGCHRRERLALLDELGRRLGRAEDLVVEPDDRRTHRLPERRALALAHAAAVGSGSTDGDPTADPQRREPGDDRDPAGRHERGGVVADVLADHAGRDPRGDRRPDMCAANTQPYTIPTLCRPKASATSATVGGTVAM